MRYKIKDLAPGLDGLIVEGKVNELLRSDMIAVTKISNESVIVGDRSVSTPLVADKLFIASECLEQLDDKQREYAHDNPFGKALFSGELNRGWLTATYVQFECGLSVTLRESDPSGMKKTLYAQNFFGNADKLTAIKRVIENALGDEEEAEDLIFTLRDIKEQEG